MKKIVLTSCGIIDEKFRNEFLKLFAKPPQDLKVLYIPIAADVEDQNDLDWLKEEYETILNLGIQKENITEYRLDYDIPLMQFDFLYMMGGNTFYLLKKIRESNFKTKLEKAMAKGLVYVGSSAGSIILGNTIECALLYDENKNYVSDFTGLKLINGIIIPHANRKEEFINQQKKQNQDRIIPISDTHGVIITDNKEIVL